MAISDIKLVDEGSADAFVSAVMYLIGRGYQPFGQPFNTGVPSIGARYCLLMINGNIKVDTNSDQSGQPLLTQRPQIIVPAEGDTLSLNYSSTFQTLVLNPAADLSAVTIYLYHGVNLDGSRARLLCTKNVAAVTWAAGDAFGGPLANPTSLVAGTVYEWEWDATYNYYVRIQ